MNDTPSLALKNNLKRMGVYVKDLSYGYALNGHFVFWTMPQTHVAFL